MSVKGSFHQHYHFIRQLAEALNKKLTGAMLNDAFTLSRQELVLVFDRLTVKVVAKFHTGFLLFEDHPYVKGSNALACFEAVHKRKVVRVLSHHYNRSFEIVFEHDARLIFKCYDAFINVIQVEDGSVTDMFRESIANDWNYNEAEFDVKDEKIIGKLNAVPVHEGEFKVVKTSEGFKISLGGDDGEIFAETTDPLEASSVFARHALGAMTFEQEKKSRIASLHGEIKKYRQQVSLNEKAIEQLLHESPFEETGHIIMANLHMIKPGLKQVDLFDFYHNRTITIKLKEDLSAADNAAYYYRKAKNKKIEVEQLEQKLAALRKKLTESELRLEQVEQAETMRQLKLLKGAKKQEPPFPFKKFHAGDFEIWVGKNAANNDLLTQKYAHKNDLWLHAKDVSGSHTVIRHKAGKPFPPAVIGFAAQVAAYYSKHKGSALAPVTYTLKKYVRKPKGSEPGQVVVDREEVIMVEPVLPG